MQFSVLALTLASTASLVAAQNSTISNGTATNGTSNSTSVPDESSGAVGAFGGLNAGVVGAAVVAGSVALLL